MLALKQGNTAVFAEVFEMSFQKTVGFMMKRTNHNKELAKELTQLTYIKLWQSRHTLSEFHPLDKQLFVIAKCTLIDHIRKEAKGRKTMDVTPQNIGTLEVMSDIKTASFESEDYFTEVLKPLPPASKKILRLKFFHGYSNKEIAETLSISTKTVEGHVTKGLHQLRHDMKHPIAFTLFIIFTLLF